ncbi:G domain-containing protein [Favolaschia claudopus]|uniref:G domain-containing protein n=1 Tax=Favolaschia claudopus TaxID=2862362 RepID=A0AAV9Z3V7_9AGAR
MCVVTARDRFRVLVVGKTGVGKSSLISFAFGVDRNAISHYARGVSDIVTEHVSDHNPRFVAHDSMGFERGETMNLDTVRKFLEARSGGTIPLKDRVHMIWSISLILASYCLQIFRLCVAVPFAEFPAFKNADDNMIQLAWSLKVPVIVVFTQYDRLVHRMEEILIDEDSMLDDEHFDRIAADRAEAKFLESCVKPLEARNPGMPYERTFGLRGEKITPPSQTALRRLLSTTQRLVQKSIGGDVWVVTAMAQRVSALQKIDASIQVGMKRYWQGLASAASFGNSTLETCLVTIHQEIAESWNFYDPRDLLNGPVFRNRVKALAQLAMPEEMDAGSWFENIDHIQTLLGLGTAIAAPVAPAVAAIGLSALFLHWLSRTIHRTPEILRCLMAYILDITLVMDQLFLVVLATHPPRALTAADIDTALESYMLLNLGDVHKDVRIYVTRAKFLQILAANSAEQKVKELLQKYATR